MTYNVFGGTLNLAQSNPNPNALFVSNSTQSVKMCSNKIHQVKAEAEILA